MFLKAHQDMKYPTMMSIPYHLLSTTGTGEERNLAKELDFVWGGGVHCRFATGLLNAPTKTAFILNFKTHQIEQILTERNNVSIANLKLYVKCVRQGNTSKTIVAIRS
jgi:hypothetical protein